MADGKGCTCAAWNANECCCDVDWTPQATYDLQDQVKALTAENSDLRREAEFLRMYGNKDCTAMADDAIEQAKAQVSTRQQRSDALDELALIDADFIGCETDDTKPRTESDGETDGD